MDSNYADNLTDALLKLQDSLNDLVKYTYLTGFQDGEKLGQKASVKEAGMQGDEEVNDFMSELKPNKPSVLSEVEQILKNYL